MQRVYACITEQHDLRLVILAALICIYACSISMNLFVRASDAGRDRALSWLFASATVFGTGVWATHFIAELAYEPGFPIDYDVGLTALSLVAAIGAVWLGMFVAHRFAAPVLGGAMIGAGIAAMHYTGMAALRAPAQLHWDAGYVLTSGAIAMTFAAAAMFVSSWKRLLPGRPIAALLLLLAIVGLHFTTMAAVTLVPDPLIAVPGHAIAPNVLAFAIAMATALIAGLGLLGMIVDDYLASRAVREAERIRRSEDHLARAQRIAHAGSIEKDLRTGAIDWFGEIYQIFGLDPNLPPPVGEAFLALFHPDDRAACKTHEIAGETAAAGWRYNRPCPSLRFRIVQPGGAVRWVRHEAELVLDQHGVATRWIGTYKDVTKAVELEESFRLLFEANPVPMWVFDPVNMKFLAVNDAAVKHYGYDRESFLTLTVLDIVPQKDRDNFKNAIRNTPHVREGGPSHVWQHVKADETEIDVRTYWRITTFFDRPAQLVAIMDVTEQCEAEARIAHMAHYDALTDLPNRVLFCERLDEALLRVGREQDEIAVLGLDLDRFKTVNDTLGHAAGDKLLQVVAGRLRSCLRGYDMAARFGGDEFAVLQLGPAGPHEAGALAERIITLLSEPYDIDGQQVEIGASIGIALDGDTTEQLLRNADLALYRAKKNGRRTYCFFQPSMGSTLRARRTQELDSRSALPAGEFV
jgi:diguanylate cyclase (GGDEF)-like protein/PAS domain S-box-containing protein